MAEMVVQYTGEMKCQIPETCFTIQQIGFANRQMPIENANSHDSKSKRVDFLFIGNYIVNLMLGSR